MIHFTSYCFPPWFSFFQILWCSESSQVHHFSPILESFICFFVLEILQLHPPSALDLTWLIPVYSPDFSVQYNVCYLALWSDLKYNGDLKRQDSTLLPFKSRTETWYKLTWLQIVTLSNPVTLSQFVTIYIYEFMGFFFINLPKKWTSWFAICICGINE